MHEDHHDSKDDHGHSHADGRHSHPHHQMPPLGHNDPAGAAVQWQTPHLPHDHQHELPASEQDIDLVENAFVEGISRSTDVSSFLRLAGIPFVGETGDGKVLHLLRVETENIVDVGSIMPLVGGTGVTYHPLPAQLASRRQRLAFIYNDGTGQMRLSFAAARALADKTSSTQFPILEASDIQKPVK